MNFLDEVQINPTSQIPGLKYIPEYIGPQQENDLIRIIDAQPWMNNLKRRARIMAIAMIIGLEISCRNQN